MAATTEPKDSVRELPPPSDKTLEIKDKWFLILEVAWIIIQILPQIFLSFFRKLFQQPKSLRGQVALVTGGARGLGRGLAMALAEERCKVAVVDVNLAAAEDTAEEIRRLGGHAKAFYCNVAKTEEIRKLRSAVSNDLGPVDLLVNNAGLMFCANIEHSSEEDISGVISVNLLSHCWMVKEFLPDMKKRNLGHIVAISSVASYFGVEGASVYVATKFGVKGFMECVRLELNSIPNNKIQTTTVCPYFINTSADYVESWNIRLPAMSIKDAVEATIAAIKANEVLICIPAQLHYLLTLSRLLPQSICDKLNRIFYVKVKPLGKEEKTPTIAIIEDLAKHKSHSNG